MDAFATELQRAVADQSAGQQPGFAQDLKAVTNTQHESAVGRESLDGLHHRAETRDCAGAQIIAIAEPARNHCGIDATERAFLMPQQMSRVSQHVPQNVNDILVAIRSGKLQDGEIHSSSKRYSSITGLLRILWQASSICLRAVSLSAPSNSISKYLPTCTAPTPA